jgi:hypothetical protein
MGDDDQWKSTDFQDLGWETVTTPHNWDDYHGYHAVSHGNLHGTAWYRTRFTWKPQFPGERLYAFFEGVGSYAAVYCNGRMMGEHAGGRTTFTMDLTDALTVGKNLLAVRARHPEGIDDLPFVCGGCWGAPHTEGSQPFGIFRPAWLERTGPVRIAPFGVHLVTSHLDAASATIQARVELSNPQAKPQRVTLRTQIQSPDGEIVLQKETVVDLAPAAIELHVQTFSSLPNPELWGPDHPKLYRAVTTVEADGLISHQAQTTFGLRWIEWPFITEPDADRNVASPDSRGRLLSDGSEEPTLANNGLTQVLFRSEEAGAVTQAMGVLVRQTTPFLPNIASLSVDIKLEGTEKTDLLCEIQNEGGSIFFHQYRKRLSPTCDGCCLTWDVPPINTPHEWTTKDPYLHKLTLELRSTSGELWERSETLFGIRDTTGPLNLNRPTFEPENKPSPLSLLPPEKKVLRVNGAPVFLNGTCEYENLLGCDHAFTDAQIAADVAMMHSAGFNAFRDAHHPHNLRYYEHWDRLGMLCWTQMGTHIWHENPQFRKHMKQCVAEWVRERRNHPCIILWGLQNESVIPFNFARELRELIRQLDPSSPQWRLTTTCNGGKGSDWNVPQEWSGTYGGNCNDYNLDRLQLVGEYGAWRSFGLHTETAYNGDENDQSETWACYAMETKIRLGEASRNQAIGHFHWIFNSFPNPGRTAENFEGAGNAEIGSINNKGLVTAWHQPSDLYYLFRSNYASAQEDPMVYIVSHTWPERWKTPGPHDIHIYSNCEEVELYNGVCARSLGTHGNPGRGRHFVWKKVELKTNVLFASARNHGKEVACDLIALQYLPEDPSLGKWLQAPANLPGDPGRCLYRVSCGADTLWTDPEGNEWMPDQPWDEKSWGWTSWGNRFDNVPDDLASRANTLTPVRGTLLSEVYRTSRYGRDDLRYSFQLPAGNYRVRLHFAESWFGVGSSQLDCRGWRMFDVAINDQVIEKDLDIWAQAQGTHCALVKEYDITLHQPSLCLHFPHVRVNQAIICGIEIFEGAGSYPSGHPRSECFISRRQSCAVA